MPIIDKNGKIIEDKDKDKADSFEKSAGTFAFATEPLEGIDTIEDFDLSKDRMVENERTSQLFADTILQTFGLPPHTPIPEEKYAVKTMGKPMDFDMGTQIILSEFRSS